MERRRMKTNQLLTRRRVKINNSKTSRLLPPDTLRWMRRAFGLSNRLRTTPFEWTSGQCAPTRNTDGWRKIVWIFNILLSVFHEGFSLKQCYQTLQNEGATLSNKIFIMFQVVWCTYSVILQISNILRLESVPEYTRSFIAFLRDLRGFVTPGELLPAVKAGKVIIIMTLSSTRIIPVLYGCLAYVRPTNPAFWSASLPATHEIWPMRALLAFMQFYVVMLMCDAGSIYITISFPYVSAVLDILRLMSDRVKEGNLEAPMQRMFELYQQLRLLTLAYDQATSIVLVSTKFCFMAFGMFSTYGCLRTEGMMSLLFGACGGFSVVFLVVYMMLLGEMHSRATEFLHAVKIEMATERRTSDTQWMRRQLWPMPALKIKVGSMYFIGKPIVMTTCRILVDSCINVLLMTA